MTASEILFCLDPNAGSGYPAAQDTDRESWKHISILSQVFQAPSTAEQRRAGEITTKISSKLPQKCFPFLPEKHYTTFSPYYYVHLRSYLPVFCNGQLVRNFLNVFESIIS